MKITTEIDEKTLLKEVLMNLPEYVLTFGKARKGMKKMLASISKGKIPGLFESVGSALDAGMWDAGCVDARLQYSIFGKLIYG